MNPCNGQQVRAGQIFNPLSGRVINGQFCRDPFPDNEIPASAINPIGRAVINQFPEPNLPGFEFNFSKPLSARTADPRVEARIDRQAGEHRLFFSGSAQRQEITNENAFGTPAFVPADTYAYPWIGRAGHARVFGRHWLVETRFGHTFAAARLGPVPEYDIRKLGFPDAVAKGQQAPAYPAFAFTGYSSQGPLANVDQRQTMDVVSSSVTRMSGGHAWKFGGVARHEYARRLMIFGTGFAFSNIWTQVNGTTAAGGNPFAAVLLGLPNNGTTGSPVPDGGSSLNPGNLAHHWSHAWFAQDDWRLSRRLTLNLGLRWDLQLPMAENNNLFSWFDPEALASLATRVPGLKGAAVFATPSRRNHWRRNWRDFAPRLGLALRLSEHTAIRSGFAVYFGPNVWQATPSIGIRGPGFFGFTPYAGTLDGNNPLPGVNLSNPFPTGFAIPVGLGGQPSPDADLGLLMSYVPARSPTAQIRQWNFSVQRRVRKTICAEAAYQGASGANLADRGFDLNQLPAGQLGPRTLALTNNPFFGAMPLGPLAGPLIPAGQLLRPFPQYAAVNLTNPALATSSYHGLAMKVFNRFDSGLAYLVSYTISKAIDTNSGAAFYLDSPSPHQDRYRLEADRAISDNDVPQRLTASFSYGPPFRGRRSEAGRSAVFSRCNGESRSRCRCSRTPRSPVAACCGRTWRLAAREP